MAKRNWGNTADWVNASANIAQASAMRKANQTMQQQNALIAEQNMMMKEQNVRLQQIADTRRLVLEVEHNVPQYVTMAINFPEYVVCELTLLEEHIRTQSACFHELGDLERSNKLIVNLSNMRNTIQNEMDDAQLEVVSFLPTIPSSVDRIDEGIGNKKKLEKNTHRLEDRKRRHRSMKKMSIIPVILMVLMLPLTYYLTSPELQDANLMKIEEHKVIFYEGDYGFNTTNGTFFNSSFSLMDMKSFGEDLEDFPIIEDWESSRNDLIDMLKTTQSNQVNQISRWNCTWPNWDDCRGEGLYYVNGSKSWGRQGNPEFIDVQIDGQCETLLSRHCVIEYSGTWSMIGIDSEDRVTEITQSEVSLKSYLVGYRAKTHPSPEVPSQPYFIDETIEYESESYVINYNFSTEDFSIFENDEIYQYLESENKSSLGNSEYDPGYCPLLKDLGYIEDCSLRGYEVNRRYSDTLAWQDYIYGDLDTLILSSENNNCENLNEDLLKDDRGFDRSTSCSGDFTASLLTGAPFALIFIGLYRTPSKIKKLINNEKELTTAISEAGFFNIDKEEMESEKQRLVEYNNRYSPFKI